MRISGLYDEQALQDMQAGPAPVILLGRPGSMRRRVVLEHLADGRAIIEIDASLYASLQRFTDDLLGSVIRVVGGSDPEHDESAALKLAAQMPFDLRAVLAQARGEPGSLTLSDVVGLLPPASALVIRSAEALVEPWAAEALWAIRGRLQEMILDAQSKPSPSRGVFKLVLLARPWHRLELAGPDAPFLGAARTIELELTSTQAWHRWLQSSGYRISPDVYDLLKDASTGLPQYALEILSASTDESVAQRIEWAVRRADGRGRMALRTAREVHPLGPTLLRAVACGEPPYRSAPATASKTIAKVLRALRRAELIYQPEPKKWRVCDPLLERLWSDEASRRHQGSMARDDLASFQRS